MQAALSDEPDALRWADEDGAGALHWAVETGVPSLIAYAMGLGADIELPRSDGSTPLLLALGSAPGNLRDRLGRSDALVMNHGAVMGTLLGGGAEYVLSAACALGDVARVQQILEDDPDAAGDLDSRRRSPLSHAAQWGHYDIVKTLLDAGADPNQPEQEAPRGNALFEASAHNHVAIVELLLAAGADPNASKESSGTCLTIAGYAQPDDSAETQALLRRHGARTPTFAMAPADLREALETDDPIVYTGEQFVHQVFGGEDLPILRLLLERHPDALRCFPLCGSMYPRWRDGLELLFAFGFGPDLRDWLGKTMLHCAAMENDVEAAALMLERGADINAVEAEDRATPLAMAARRGHEEMVIFLLERGADPDLPAEEWARPATVARDAGHEEIASLIERSTA